MKHFIKFVLLFIVIIAVSAVLAPILFRFLPFKFERIFNRLVMIFSLVAAVFFVRIKKERWAEWGFVWQADSLKRLGLGFLSGILILTAVAVVRFWAGDAQWSLRDLTASEWLVKALKIIPAAFLIGVIEEFFFRAFVFRTLHKAWGWNLALSLGVTNFFYAVLHFVGAKKIYIGPNPTVIDSFKLLFVPFKSFLLWENIWTGVIGLFLFGLLLSYLFLRTGSLYTSIGLHAGCVFFLKSSRLFVDFLKTKPLLYGTDKLYDGILGWTFLLLLWAAWRLYLPKKPPESKVYAV